MNSRSFCINTKMITQGQAGLLNNGFGVLWKVWMQKARH